jgi:hypothetical protein
MTHSSTAHRWRRVTAAAIIVPTVTTLAACSPDRLVRSDPPSNIIPSGVVTTATAATALYNGAVSLFAVAFGGGSNGGGVGYVSAAGLITDELALAGGSQATSADMRNSSLNYAAGGEDGEMSGLYVFLQTARVGAFQARQGLQQYGPENSTPLIGRMYALEAYTITMLAEYFCNGVPLSETPLGGNTVLSAGLTTDELLAHASALFDTAITLSADSANYLNMARVGKGRVLLDQGRFAEAAAAVADVPFTFVYNVQYSAGTSIQTVGYSYNVWNYLVYPYSFYGRPPAAVLDREGGNGLPWSTDPRVPIATDNGVTYPAKYDNESAPIRLADGVEAQLIRAEADLQAGGSAWLGMLNDLRANCTSASGCAPVPGITGGTAQLPPLPDSGTAAGRVREVMTERAYWLYATGHRQGDLRRMLRPPYRAAPYNFTQSSVYPTGAYSNPTYTGPTVAYGADVVATPAASEKRFNRKYAGCFDLNP